MKRPVKGKLPTWQASFHVGLRRPLLQQGFTLIELLISMAMGLGVLVAMASVYVAAKQTFKFQETGGRMQEDANFVLESMARNLRMAGFAGCALVDAVSDGSGGTKYYPAAGLSPVPTAITSSNPLGTLFSSTPAITVQPLTPYNFLRGFDSVPSAMIVSGDDAATSSTPALYFAGGSANVVNVSAAMTVASDALTIAADPYDWRNGVANSAIYTFIVSDCNNSSLFYGKVNTAGTSIAHTATALGNSADNFQYSPLFTNAAGGGAVVMPLEWYFYYIGTRTGASTPSLYLVRHDGNARKQAEEIVTNVESLGIHYGENTKGKVNRGATDCDLATGGATCYPTLQPDVWRTTASAVTAWNNVMAVRIGLMMVSDDSTVAGDIVKSTPTLLGQAYTLPTGASTARLRKEFSTTVSVRNRMPPR